MLDDAEIDITGRRKDEIQDLSHETLFHTSQSKMDNIRRCITFPYPFNRISCKGARRVLRDGRYMWIQRRPILYYPLSSTEP